MLDFAGWRDAWRHEARDAHGRWTRVPGPADIRGKFDEGQRGGRKPVTAREVSAELRKAREPLAKESLDKAAAALNAGDYDEATHQLRNASAYTSDTETSDRLFQMAASLSEESRTNATVAAFAEKARNVVPSLLGGGHEVWNGKIDLFNAADQPAIAAALDWDGTMEFQRELAARMRDERSRDPDPYVIALHELIHGTMPQGQEDRMHQRAYQDPTNVSIEEGFTELGTIHHAPEFFVKMGIGGRETSNISVSGAGHIREAFSADELAARRSELDTLVQQAMQAPAGNARAWLGLRQARTALGKPEPDMDAVADELSKASGYALDPGVKSGVTALMHAMDIMPGQVRYASMAEYAKRLRDPDRIAKGVAWGHYGWQTAAAQAWVRDAARAEGKGPKSPRVRDLADEINREGTAGKVPAMARQVIRAAGADPDKFQGAPFTAVEDLIREQWAQGFAEAQRSPWEQAIAAVKQYDREH